MTQTDTKQWPPWRTKRLLQILDYKAQGLTDQKTADKMSLSRSTIYRELNSSQAAELGRALRKRAEGMIWPLIERQLRQIEDDPSIKPAQKLIYRGQLISILTSLVPKQIEQKIEGEIRTYDVEALLDRVIKQEDLLEKNR